METETQALAISFITTTPSDYQPYVSIPDGAGSTFTFEILVPYPDDLPTPTVTCNDPKSTTDPKYKVEIAFTGTTTSTTLAYYSCSAEITLPSDATKATLEITTKINGNTGGATVLQYEDADGSGDIVGVWMHQNNA